jgi:hypothetical protein
MTDKLGTGSVHPAPRVDVTAYPTLECFTKAHTGPFFFGFIGVAFNFFVCPIFLFYRLGLSLLEEKMSEQDSLRSFGDFYGMYERKYWWWHAVVILRRWFFILTCSLLSPIGYFQVSSCRVCEQPLIVGDTSFVQACLCTRTRRRSHLLLRIRWQVLVGISVSAVSILLSVLLRPYKDDRYNRLDLVLQAATLLLVASAVANTMTMSIGHSVTTLCRFRPCARTHRVFAVMMARFL